MRAQAAPSYLARRAETTAPAQEHYVFAQGQFFPSPFDSEVKAVSFAALTKIVAADFGSRLAPASYTSQADVVIVMHWGAVARPESIADSLRYDPDSVQQAGAALEDAKVQAAAEFRAGNYMGARGMVAAAESNLSDQLQLADSIYTSDARRKASTAELIGIRGLYTPSDMSAEADAIRSLLEDDRYFVALTAYDAKALQLKLKKVVWSIRMSVPIAGRDFVTAVRQMAATAGPYCGTQQPRMILARPDQPNAAPAN